MDENQEPTYYYNEVVFNQTGLPEFRLRGPDLFALANLFASTRFKGFMGIGWWAESDTVGVVMALLTRNVSEVFDNMAESMTELLRSRPDDVAKGVAVASVVFVRICWTWMGLPVGVTLTAALFLLATIIISRMHQCEPLEVVSSSVAVPPKAVVQSEKGVVLTSEMKSLAEMEQKSREDKGSASVRSVYSHPILAAKRSPAELGAVRSRCPDTWSGQPR